jgi:hypothetical protein
MGGGTGGKANMGPGGPKAWTAGTTIMAGGPGGMGAAQGISGPGGMGAAQGIMGGGIIMGGPEVQQTGPGTGHGAKPTGWGGQAGISTSE